MPETFHEWFPLLVVFLVTRSWLRPSADTEAVLATREPRDHQKKTMFPICFIGGFVGKLFGPQRRLKISKIDNIDSTEQQEQLLPLISIDQSIKWISVNSELHVFIDCSRHVVIAEETPS